MKKYIIFFVTIINFISFSCFVFSYEDCSIENSNYSADLNWAYIRACNNWLIVSKTINDSNLEERITRAELAKLMVLYNKVILSKTSILTWNIPYYTDVNQGIWSFFNYINLAYNYQIMWIYADGTPLKKFYPYKFVTRGEAATVLSRVFFWNKYNTWGVNFYSNHINRLKNEGILFNDDPLYIETKWSILLMLYNSEPYKEIIENFILDCFWIENFFDIESIILLIEIFTNDIGKIMNLMVHEHYIEIELLWHEYF